MYHEDNHDYRHTTTRRPAYYRPNTTKRPVYYDDYRRPIRGRTADGQDDSSDSLAGEKDKTSDDAVVNKEEGNDTKSRVRFVDKY